MMHEALPPISDARYKANNTVQSKTNGGAGNLDKVIKHMRQDVEIFIVEDPLGSPNAWGEDLGLSGRLHPVSLRVGGQILRELRSDATI